MGCQGTCWPWAAPAAGATVSSLAEPSRLGLTGAPQNLSIGTQWAGKSGARGTGKQHLLKINDSAITWEFPVGFSTPDNSDAQN